MVAECEKAISTLEPFLDSLRVEAAKYAAATEATEETLNSEAARGASGLQLPHVEEGPQRVKSRSLRDLRRVP